MRMISISNQANPNATYTLSSNNKKKVAPFRQLQTFSLDISKIFHPLNALKMAETPLTTTIVIWVFTVTSLLIMGTRLRLRKVRAQKFDIGDYLTAVGMLLLAVRCGVMHN